jgi:hypothetical protein
MSGKKAADVMLEIEGTGCAEPQHQFLVDFLV